MEIIIGIIVGLFTIVGIVLLVKENRKRAKTNTEKEVASTPASDCCGAHDVCEVDEIMLDENIIEYYDDEELDEYKNKDSKGYTSTQIDQFRDVLYTLKTQEIRFWLLSIERRHIKLPAILISEARSLMAEG